MHIMSSAVNFAPKLRSEVGRRPLVPALVLALELDGLPMVPGVGWRVWVVAACFTDFRQGGALRLAGSEVERSNEIVLAHVIRGDLLHVTLLSGGERSACTSDQREHCRS